MIVETVTTVAKNVANEVRKAAIETVKACVEQLPDKIGDLSDVELLPEKIDIVPEDNFPITNSEGTSIPVLESADDLANRISLETDETPEPKKGGSYKDVRIEGEGDKFEVHHMPSDSSSDIERNDGPAIKMEKEDHRQTASCGMSTDAREYRERQKQLISEGKFREALQMDIDDIHDKFGDKYDDAIAEMLEYVDQLEMEGKI
ncbi:MAG: hypothetical protein KAZ47_00600 [Streptococcus sp.]|nr:hypothetical protein [Streptococcus sp.]